MPADLRWKLLLNIGGELLPMLPIPGAAPLATIIRSLADQGYQVDQATLDAIVQDDERRAEISRAIASGTD